MSVNGAGVRQRKTVVVNAPGDEDLPAFTPPPFTIKELFAAIPALWYSLPEIHVGHYLRFLPALPTLIVDSLLDLTAFARPFPTRRTNSGTGPTLQVPP
jgi:hypothetical protein